MELDVIRFTKYKGNKMPIYEYECEKCNRRFEHLLKGSRDSPSVCPHCGAKKVKKVFSSFSVATGGMKDHSTPADCASCPSTGCPHRGN